VTVLAAAGRVSEDFRDTLQLTRRVYEWQRLNFNR
jgi:hypothetical protein